MADKPSLRKSTGLKLEIWQAEKSGYGDFSACFSNRKEAVPGSLEVTKQYMKNNESWGGELWRIAKSFK